MNNKADMENHILNKQVEILDCKLISARLKTSDEYVYRHIGNSEVTINKALKAVGANTIDELIDEIVPEDIRLTAGNRFKHNGKELSGIDSETLMLHRMRSFKDNNTINKNFIGQGFYGVNVPSVIRRNVLENPKWYTPYTPYQAEIAQGRLESLINF